jgi:hypothetical protein
MKFDHERWAETLAIQKQHGNDAPAFVARQVEQFARTGDTAGVERWMAIAVRLDQLQGGTVH